MSEQLDSPFEDSPETSSGQSNAKSKPARWQFSMGALFGLSFVFILLCSAMSTADYIFGATAMEYTAFGMVIFSIPAILTTGVVYSRGYRRTFFIGTMFPGIGSLYLLRDMVGLFGQKDGYAIFSLFVVCWIMLTIVSGTACIVTRWLVEPKPEAE